MRDADDRDGLIDIRHRVAGARFELAALRLAEKAGFNPSQPRVPAGNSDGGQWSDGGGSGTAVGASERRTRVFHGTDGTRISARVRSGSDAGQTYSVKLPHGATFHFNSRDGVQTISDSSGKVLRQHRWLLPAPQVLPQIRLTHEQEESLFDAGRRLFNWIAAHRPSSWATYPVLAFIARQFKSDRLTQRLQASGTLTRDEVRQICPRLEEVQTLTNEATRDAGGRDSYSSAAIYGTAVHVRLRAKIDALADPALRAERSFWKERDEARLVRGSIRVDVIEDEGDGPICIYDIKTGVRKLSTARSMEFAKRVSRDGRSGRLIIVSEIRAFE